MEDKNKPVLDQLVQNTFKKLHHLEYKISEYSLNSPFSFKFDNLSHFIEFLGQHQPVEEPQKVLLENMFSELNLKPESFFYINFFEQE
jgi:hypothetical protein